MNNTNTESSRRALLVTAGLALAAYSVPALRRGFGDIFLDTAKNALGLCPTGQDPDSQKTSQSYRRVRDALNDRTAKICFRSLAIQSEPLGPSVLVADLEVGPEANPHHAANLVQALGKQGPAIISAWRDTLRRYNTVSSSSPEGVLANAVHELSAQLDPEAGVTSLTPADTRKTTLYFTKNESGVFEMTREGPGVPYEVFTANAENFLKAHRSSMAIQSILARRGKSHTAPTEKAVFYIRRGNTHEEPAFVPLAHPVVFKGLEPVCCVGVEVAPSFREHALKNPCCPGVQAWLKKRFEACAPGVNAPTQGTQSGPEIAPAPAVWEGFVVYSRSGNSVRLFLDQDDINPEAIRTRVTGHRDMIEALAKKKWFSNSPTEAVCWGRIASLVADAKVNEVEARRRKAVEVALREALNDKASVLSQEEKNLLVDGSGLPSVLPVWQIAKVLALEVKRLEGLLNPATKQS